MKQPKMIISVEKSYELRGPSLAVLRAYVLFYEKQAEHFLEDKGVEYSHLLNEKDYEDYQTIRTEGQCSFDFYAPAAELYRYVHNMKRNGKDHGFTKTDVCAGTYTECYGDNAAEDDENFDKKKYFTSTARVNINVTWNAFREWCAEATSFEEAKIKHGHAKKNVAHRVHVYASGNSINVYLR